MVEHRQAGRCDRPPLCSAEPMLGWLAGGR